MKPTQIPDRIRTHLLLITALGLLLYAVISYPKGLITGDFGILPLSLLSAFVIAPGAVVYLYRKSSHKNNKLKPGVGLLLYLLFIPAFVLLLSSLRMQLSYHGSFHSAYAYQILNGNIPPENIVIPGLAGNVYWMYHSLLASISGILTIPPATAAALVNVCALCISVITLHRILAVFKVRPVIKPFLSVLILFGGNAFGFLHYLLLHPEQSLTASAGGPDLRALVLAGDPRLGQLLSKFLNLNGFPIGIMLMLIAIYFALQLAKDKIRVTNAMPLIISMLATIAFHPTSGLFVLLTVPASLVIVRITAWKAQKEKTSLMSFIKNSFDLNKTDLLVVTAASLLLALPVLHYLIQVISAFPGNNGFGVTKANLLSVFSATYPISPLVAVAIYKYIKRPQVMQGLLFGVSCIGLVLAMVLQLSDENQYKFVYLGTIALIMFCVSVLFSTGGLKGRFAPVKKGMIAVLVICTVINLALVTLAYQRSAWAQDDQHFAHGTAVVIREDNNPTVYEWLFNNSSQNAIVLNRFEYKNTSRVLLVAQRLSYVTHADVWGDGILEYENRLTEVTELFTPTGSTKLTSTLQKVQSEFPEREVYLLIERQQLTDFGLQPSELSELNIVYEDSVHVLYRP